MIIKKQRHKKYKLKRELKVKNYETDLGAN